MTCECGHELDEHDDNGNCTAVERTVLNGGDRWNSERQCRCFAYDAVD